MFRRLRPFLGCAIAIVIVCALVTGCTLYFFGTRGESFVEVNGINTYPVGSIIPLNTQGKILPSNPWPQYEGIAPIYLLHEADAQWGVLFALDPLSGCVVAWAEDVKEFHDPCNGSVYDRRGEWVSGPSPRNLDSFTARVDGDKLVVDLHLVKGSQR